jgi:hypothetical protein
MKARRSLQSTHEWASLEPGVALMVGDTARTDDGAAAVGITEPIEESRYIAQHIPGAIFRELPGADSDPRATLAHIDRFLAAIQAEEAEFDRVLATVMFPDIVGSTERSSAVGDRSWQNLLADHDRIVRGLLARYRGREIKTLGDGFLATFDGPARAIRCANRRASGQRSRYRRADRASHG